MQGPEGSQPRQTLRAGDRHPSDSDVREWQRNTWYGPAPTNENPFDEPEDAPELRSSRSDNVNEHLGDFWRAETGGYSYAPNQGMVRNPSREEPRAEKRIPRRKSLLMPVLGLILILGGILAVLRFAVFSVREIRVDGNRTLSAEAVIQSSGIRPGTNILTLDEGRIEQMINGNYRLQFKYLDKQLPSTVIIGVREREPCCWLTYCGIQYSMDKNRMVLSESEEMTLEAGAGGLQEQPEAFRNLVEVKGLQIRSGCFVGQTLNLFSPDQQLLFSELFLEMKVLGCTGEIQEADLSNLSSVLLTTRDGYTVALGDGSQIHAKLRSMLLVREELKRMEERGGTINVVTPETPLYSPPSGNGT